MSGSLLLHFYKLIKLSDGFENSVVCGSRVVLDVFSLNLAFGFCLHANRLLCFLFFYFFNVSFR